jgi:hypothetical protein
MGENTRVLPEPFRRVPEEQIMQPAKRTRRLYDGEPLDGLLGESGRALLDASLADLDQASELAELGTAQYLDRPLGTLKSHGEVDRTPLVSCVAFSRAIAKRRLAQLKALRWIDEARLAQLKSLLDKHDPGGVAAAELQVAERPGVVSLTDANKAAVDFRLLHTTTPSLAALLEPYDLAPLAKAAPEAAEFLASNQPKLVTLRSGTTPAPARAWLRIHDMSGTIRLELELAGDENERAYRRRRGVEWPARLRVLTTSPEAVPVWLTWR